jgi:glycosyltransferase involved in cell wall biosynthesis
VSAAPGTAGLVPARASAVAALFRAGALADLTVLVPAYNEAESLPELVERIAAATAPLTARTEILVINDGSTDATREVARELQRRHAQLRLLSFRRNYGKSAALAVGFKHARGSVVVTIDADLQDEPGEIPKLVERLAEGYDLVSGWKHHRKDPLVKTSTSKLFNFVTGVACGLRLHDFNCGLKAYRREVTQSLVVYGELHRYLPALAHLQGFRVTEEKVAHHARRYGTTKFGRARFLNGLFDLMTVMFLARRGTSPLHFFGRLSALFALVGGGICVYFLAIWLGGHGLRLRPLMLLGIALLLLAVQFVSLGLLAELLVASRDTAAHYQLLDED